MALVIAAAVDFACFIASRLPQCWTVSFSVVKSHGFFNHRSWR